MTAIKEVSKISAEKIEKGDLILVDLVGRLKSNNKIFDVTSEEIAKNEDVYSEKESYGPRLLVVGEGYVPAGVDNELPNMTVNETKTFELAPKDAFGERNLADIKSYSERELIKKQKIDPHKSIGKRVNIHGRSGYITRVYGGRVRVDHNHPLAGEEVIYEVTIRKKLIEDIEKIQQFVNMSFRGLEPDKVQIDILEDENKVKITLPNQVSFMQGIGYAKLAIAQYTFKYVEKIEKLEFTEIYEKKIFEPTEKPTT